MTTAIVPYRFQIEGLKNSHCNFQQRRFDENRKTVLDELRLVSGLPEVVSTLNPETVYKLVSTPQNSRIYKDAAGNLKGVFRDEKGQIVEYAKLKAIRPSLIKAASAVGSQVLLISIAMQLDQIGKNVERIIAELHNDRIAEIEAGLQQFENALWVEDRERQARMIEHAVQTLSTGLAKTLRALKKEIETLPDNRNGFWDNWGRSSSRKAAISVQAALESFYAGLLGIQTLSECYAVLNEPLAAEKVLATQIDKLSRCGIQTAADRARLAPATSGFLPEAPWKAFLQYEATAMADLRRSGAHTPEKLERIEVEFKPSELTEVQYASL
jgi:hypothetical protein